MTLAALLVEKTVGLNLPRFAGCSLRGTPGVAKAFVMVGDNEE